MTDRIAQLRLGTAADEAVTVLRRLLRSGLKSSPEHRAEIQHVIDELASARAIRTPPRETKPFGRSHARE